MTNRPDGTKKLQFICHVDDKLQYVFNETYLYVKWKIKIDFSTLLNVLVTVIISNYFVQPLLYWQMKIGIRFETKDK